MLRLGVGVEDVAPVPEMALMGTWMISAPDGGVDAGAPASGLDVLTASTWSLTAGGGVPGVPLSIAACGFFRALLVAIVFSFLDDVRVCYHDWFLVLFV